MRPGRLRVGLLVALKLGLTGGLLWLVFRFFPVAEVGERLRQVAPAWLALALALVAVQFALSVRRWQLVQQTVAPAAVPFRRLALIQGLGVFFSQVLPSTIGGDAVRCALLARVATLDGAVRSVLYDRVMGLIGLCAVALPAAAVTLLAAKSRAPSLLWPALVAAGGILLAWLVLRYAGRLERVRLIGRHLARVAAELRGLLARQGRVLLSLSLAIHLVTVLIFWLLALSLSGDAALFWPLAGIVPSAMLLSVVPVTFGGWGLREGALVAGFALAGLSASLPLAASILFGLSQVGLGLLAGLAWIALSEVGRGNAAADSGPG